MQDCEVCSRHRCSRRIDDEDADERVRRRLRGYKGRRAAEERRTNYYRTPHRVDGQGFADTVSTTMLPTSCRYSTPGLRTTKMASLFPTAAIEVSKQSW